MGSGMAEAHYMCFFSSSVWLFFKELFAFERLSPSPPLFVLFVLLRQTEPRGSSCIGSLDNS